MDANSKLIEDLVAGAIVRLSKLPSPVVRVCGPLTSGGFGYEENLRRFVVAERVLKEKGFTVFDYFADNSDELIIKEANLPWTTVMELYHEPILKSGLLTAAYFLPGSETSNGATWERNFIQNHTQIEIREFPPEWLEE